MNNKSILSRFDQALDLLREGERTMGNEERVQWKKRVGVYLSTVANVPNELSR